MLLALTAPKAFALTFNFSTTGFGAVDPTPYLTAATAAGNRWSSIFDDNVTLNVQLSYGGTTSVANSVITQPQFSYSAVTSALAAHALTVDDFSAVSNLQAGSTPSFGVNRGSGANTGWRLLSSVSTIRVASGEAKALGLPIANPAALDLTISLHTTADYDFDPSNGVTAGQYDLVGVLAHELGHGMGMGSLEESISAGGQFLTDAQMLPWLADFFRYSTRSIAALPKAFDAAGDTTPKYFSVDGGVTSLGNFALGSSPTFSGFGNGQEANHWLNTFNQAKIGIMDGLTAPGQKLDISNLDIRFFDVIGFHPVPETETWAAGIALVAGGLWTARRARRTRR